MKIKITKKDFLPHIACDVELDIGAGRILLIKGENGTGKSTLASEVFNTYSDKVSLIRQSGLDLFYDRTVAKIKTLFMDATTDQLEKVLFEKYWNLFQLDQKSDRLQSKRIS
jgi:ABC-type dipeptide/oligopeptide/nickel transport system ATPase subunit